MKRTLTSRFSGYRLKKNVKKARLFIAGVLLVTAIDGFAQDEFKRHAKTTNIELNADLVKSKGGNQQIRETISEKDAVWLRLFFEDVNLGAKSTITITSDEDGASQTLDAKSFKEWNYSTAYFNGDQLTITLNVADGEENIKATIKELSIGDPESASKSQCGFNDDRRASDDKAIGRMAPTGCTGWIIRNGRLVTAGHCVGNLQLIMFNVPKSRSNGTKVFPGPEHQYPITSVFSKPNDPGETDWAVMTAGKNSQTGLTPIQGQGKSYNVVRNQPVGPITITGFGSDTGSDNQTQQTHTAPFQNATNSRVTYVTDTTGGNSGSPIIDATGNAVGVHTFGACNTSGGFNGGTRATVPSFWAAMGLDGTTTPPNPSSAATLYVDCPFSGGSVSLEEGSYNLTQLRAKGMQGEQLSSIRVKAGYEVQLFTGNDLNGRSIIVTGDVGCLTNNNFNDDTNSIRVARTGRSGNGLVIEAEDFVDMNGIELEDCSEGGQNVANTDAGDWMSYRTLNFPRSGSYRFEYRVASAVDGAKFSTDLNAGTIVVGEIDVPNTGGWQNWRTISHIVNVEAGSYPVGIYTLSQGYNLNWIRIIGVEKTNESVSGSTFEEFKGSAITAYPNPANQFITITGSEDNGARKMFSIFTISGKQVMTNVSSNTQLDVSKLSNGIYLVKEQLSGQTFKFVKK